MVNFLLKIVLFVTAVNSFAHSNSSGFHSNGFEESIIVSNENVSNDLLEDADIATLYSSLSNEKQIFQTEYYAPYYFSNLTENFGRNVKGSCTYVALGMLLSFYDTYWGDSFIPESYDMITMLSSNELSFDIESPGTYQETYSLVGGLTTSQYYQTVEQYSNFYFHLKLIQMGKEQFGQYKFDSSSSPCGLTYSQLYTLTDYYLYTYLGKTSSEISIVSNITQNVSAKVFTISMIKQGIPVILRMGHSNAAGGHAMIAYDYDEASDEIYVHAGWGSSSTHVTLEAINYDDFWDALTIIPHSSHSHSNNYKYSNEYEELETHCACNYVLPFNIEILNGNYRDNIPTFKWYCLNHEKWFLSQNLKYHFSLLNDSRVALFTIDVDGDEYRLTQSQWDSALSLSSRKYYAYVEPFSDTHAYLGDYGYSKLFVQAENYEWATVIKPSDYGFADAYPADISTQTNYTSHSIDELTFKTRRYRTGYIHNECIVMSCIRNNINSAWIEYSFDLPVIRIDVELSYWRPISHEFLSSSNGNATFDAKINGAWATKLDLLLSSTKLPTNRNSPTWYTIEFDEPVYEIRFCCETTYVYGGENNRGRICIGNLAVWNYGAMSGDELDYDTSLWSDIPSTNNNCYAYALNNQVHPGTNDIWFKQQPGEYSGSICYTYDKKHLVAAVEADFAKYNLDYGNSLIFREVGRFEACPKGTYKVALVASINDYHWYRQDSDGYWSHKPGTTPIKLSDASNNPIFDPYLANISPYTNFIGFFAISPWGNMYEA